jgi:hypothetical protein
MPLITPSSAVVLYKNINITAGENIIFKSVANQRAYFAKHVVASVNDCTYVRKTGRLRLEFPTSTVAQCNYISFTNGAFENKTFYARIIDYEYINNVTTEIRYGIDYFQSFMFDVEYENCLIQREHLSETDFQKAEANPWDQNIYEFQTAEDLPSTKEIEKIYSYKSDNTGDVMCYPALESAGSTQGVLMQVASFDSSLEADFLSLLDTKGEVITPDATYQGSYSALFKNKLLPRPYYSIFLNLDSKLADMQEVIDWLTQNGLDTEIIGIYAIPTNAWTMWIYDQEDHYGGFTGTVDDSYISKYTNKKLCQSPYYYLRVNNNNGSTKEYKYEKFSDIVNGGKQFTMSFLSMLEGVPKTAMAPMRYMYAGGGVNVRDDINIDERIEKDAFPQIGYSSDAFLSYVSNQYNNTITSANESDIAGYALANKLGGRSTAEIPALLSGTSSLFSNVGGAIGKGVTDVASGNLLALPGDIANLGNSVVNTGITTLKSAMDAGQRYDEMDEANNRRSMTRGDIESGVYGKAKDAYVADTYHPGNNNGILNYYAGIGDISTFIITRVQLRPEILEQYDKYFSFYGYTSNRYGVPRVCNYIKGSGDQPHFDETTSKHFTYLKCGSMHVISPMMVVSEYIESLFTSGCRFLKGEDLS